MFGATKVGKQHPSPYATTTEFCQIFEANMSRLYRLSFLLTGDAPVAEQCFLGGLQTAQKGNPVFRNWAEAWTRRMIILDAIRVLHPQMTVGALETFGRVASDRATDRVEISEIVKLPVFERFAFVMSVLEGYSDHECSLHLGCTRAMVAAARVRALERIGRAAELRDKLISIASGHKPRGRIPSLRPNCSQESLAGHDRVDLLASPLLPVANAAPDVRFQKCSEFDCVRREPSRQIISPKELDLRAGSSRVC